MNKPKQTELALALEMEGEVVRQIAKGNVTLRELEINTDKFDIGADASGFDSDDWNDYDDDTCCDF